jgi:protoporphyrinogen/coproporphyrinogen III oxidase
MVTRTHTDVAVIGGGIAGLSAAYTLARAGVPFLLLEGGSRWGGVVRSEEADGFVLEAGPDALLAQKPAALELCRELGLADRLVPSNGAQRKIYVLRDGRLRAAPDGMVLGIPSRLFPVALSPFFSWAGKVRMAKELLVPRRREPGDESVGDFFRRRLGAESLERMVEPLLGAIHAADVDRLSMEATLPRLLALERRHGSLVGGLRSEARRASGTGAPFYALRGGLGELVEALVARLPAASLRTRARVEGLSRSGMGYRIALAGGQSIRARAVILALPPPRAAAVLRRLDGPLADLLGNIRFSPAATVLLGYRREDVAHPLDGYGVVIPRSEGRRCLAWSFASTKFPGRAPEGHVLLRAFLGGVRDPEVLGQGDAWLAMRALQEMDPVLGLRRPPVLQRVFRWPAATPQLQVGHQERVAWVDERLTHLPGLRLTGAGLRGTGVPDCIEDGRRTAQAILQELAGWKVPALTSRSVR